MKRSIFYSVLGVAAIVAAFAGRSAYASSHAVVRVAAGESCIIDGRSGYMVSTGRGPDQCVASPEG